MWYQGQAAKGTSYFTEYFNPARNYKNQEALLKVYAPRNVREEMDNVFYQLEIGGKWGTVYVLALEFDPRKEVIEWAAKLLENYKDKCVFLITHMYINTDAEISCKNIGKYRPHSYFKRVFVAPTVEIKLLYLLDKPAFFVLGEIDRGRHFRLKQGFRGEAVGEIFEKEFCRAYREGEIYM